MYISFHSKKTILYKYMKSLSEKKLFSHPSKENKTPCIKCKRRPNLDSLKINQRKKLN